MAVQTGIGCLMCPRTNHVKARKLKIQRRLQNIEYVAQSSWSRSWHLHFLLYKQLTPIPDKENIKLPRQKGSCSAVYTRLAKKNLAFFITARRTTPAASSRESERSLPCGQKYEAKQPCGDRKHFITRNRLGLCVMVNKIALVSTWPTAMAFSITVEVFLVIAQNIASPGPPCMRERCKFSKLHSLSTSVVNVKESRRSAAEFIPSLNVIKTKKPNRRCPRSNGVTKEA